MSRQTLPPWQTTGCRAKQPEPEPNPNRYCTNCGEYLPTGATLNLDPAAAVWSLLTTAIIAIICAAFLLNLDSISPAEPRPTLDEGLSPLLALAGPGFIVYYIIITAKRRARGDRAAILDFAITYAIGITITVAIDPPPGPGNNAVLEDLLMPYLFPAAVALPVAYNNIRHIRRKLAKATRGRAQHPRNQK